MRYNPALDGIRALAVLAVVCHHAFVPGFENGRAGVDVFFVLSGYLITTLLAAEEQAGGIRLGAFYLRRARRLYPALLLMVGLTALAFLALGRPLSWADAGITLMYLSDFTAASGVGPAEAIKHTWSLSVEEHYYLLWPVAVTLLSRLPRRAALWTLGLAYLAASFWRLHIAADVGEWVAYYRFDTRLSGLLLGSFLALAPPVRLPYAALAAALAVATITSTLDMALTIVPSEWLGACLVLWAVQGSRLLTLKPLPYLGRISYGVYLFHFPIATLAHGLPWPQALGWTLGGAVLLAAASYATVERVFRSVSRRRLEGGVADAVA